MLDKYRTFEYNNNNILKGVVKSILSTSRHKPGRIHPCGNKTFVWPYICAAIGKSFFIDTYDQREENKDGIF